MSDSEQPFQLELGARGKLKGSDWQVIGRIRFDWEVEGERGYFLEYILSNISEGEAYLTEANGHWQFGRKTDERPGKPLSSGVFPKQVFKVGKEKYNFMEKTPCTLTYADGDIPFEFEIGETYEFAEAVSKSKILVEETSYNDDGSPHVEYFLNEYMDVKKMKKIFGVKKTTKGIAANQSYPRLPFEKTIRRLGIAASVFMLFGTCIAMGSGEDFFTQEFRAGDLFNQDHLSKPFTIEEKGTTLEIDVKAPRMRNRWIEFGIGIYKASGEKIIAADDTEISYYAGYSGGESWSEGSRTATFYWKIKEPGTYRLNLSINRKPEYRQQVYSSQKITVKMRKDVNRAWLMFVIFLFWPSIPRYLIFRRRNFETRRWAKLM